MVSRKAWLDWQRGLAVLFMIEVHILTGWTLPHEMRGALFHNLRFIGGLAAPGFLYMAGLAVALLDASCERRGMSAHERVLELVRRGLYVLGAAYSFRVMEYILGGAFRVPGGYHALLKVDILNVIGAALVLCALVARCPPRYRFWVTLSLALATVLYTPVIAGWPSAHRMTGYLYPVKGTGFSLFPWAAFAFFGYAVGMKVALGLKAGRVLLVAAAVAWLGYGLTKLDVRYGLHDYWHTSPAWFFWRLAITLALSGVLMLLVPYVRLRFLSLLGRHSLLVYMLSVELTYGFTSRPVRGALTLMQSVVGMLAMTALCGGICWLVEREKPIASLLPSRMRHRYGLGP